MERTASVHGILSNSVIYCTALYLAAQNGHRDVVKYLSELPIVPATDGIFEFTSVYLAAQKGNLDIFKYTFENVIAGAIEKEDVCEITNDQNEDEQANEVDTGEASSQNVAAEQIEDVIVCNSIFEAAEIGWSSKIKSFVDQGIDINVKDENGFALLHIAAKAGATKCVELLLEYGANIECKTNETWNEKTAIHIACENKHFDVALVLINKGANVEAKDKFQRSALYHAAKSGSAVMVQLLLNKGADMNALDVYGYPILSEARNKNILNILLEKGYDYKRITSCGTILQAASEYDNAILADFIFEMKINVNIHETKYNSLNSAIVVAAQNNNCKVMEILLKNGANVQDSYRNEYPLLKAIANNHYEAAKLLLENNANVNELEVYTETTPLILAVKRKNIQIIHLLSTYKPDGNIEDSYGFIALDYVNRKKHPEIVNILNRL